MLGPAEVAWERESKHSDRDENSQCGLALAATRRLATTLCNAACYAVTCEKPRLARALDTSASGHETASLPRRFYPFVHWIIPIFELVAIICVRVCRAFTQWRQSVLILTREHTGASVADFDEIWRNCDRPRKYLTLYFLPAIVDTEWVKITLESLGRNFVKYLGNYCLHMTQFLRKLMKLVSFNDEFNDVYHSVKKKKPSERYIKKTPVSLIIF